MRVIFFGSIAIVIEIILIISMYYMIHDRIEQHEYEIASNSALLVNYGFSGSGPEEYETSAKKIKRDMALLKAIKENRADLSKVLASIGSNLPNSVWLKQLQLKDGVFDATGYSKEASTLNDFVEALSATSLFEKMQLKKLKKAKLHHSEVLVFKLSGQMF